MRTSTWCSAVLLLLSCPCAFGVTLVRDGQPAATIVLPVKTEFDAYTDTDQRRFDDEEKLAAIELQTFIEKISGAKLPIVTADAQPQGTVILLGAELARAQGLGEQIDKLDRDGLICVVKDDALILTGSATGQPADPEELRRLRALFPEVPILIARLPMGLSRAGGRNRPLAKDDRHDHRCDAKPLPLATLLVVHVRRREGVCAVDAAQ